MLKNLTLLFLLCAAPLCAQDECSLNASPPCDDVDPFAFFDMTFCEWRVFTDGHIVLTTDDAVTWSNGFVLGSGHHPHLGFGLDRPPFVFRDHDGQVRTGADGCLTMEVELPGFAGSYIVQAEGTNGRGLRRVGAHWLNNSLSGTASQMLLSGDISYHYDPWHGATSLDTAWVANHVQFKFMNMGPLYRSLTGRQLQILRCGLQEAGISDNDYGPNILQPAGSWHTRVWEGHEQLSSCDMQNEALNGDDPFGTRFSALASAVNMAGCSFGKMKPDLAGAADAAFWQTQKNVHVNCAITRLSLPLPGGGHR